MWPLAVILGGLILWHARKRDPGAPPGYERLSGLQFDAAAGELLDALQDSGQQTLAIGDYLARWEFETDPEGQVRRTIAIYRKKA